MKHKRAMTFVGIDPGLEGAMVAINTYDEAEGWLTPTTPGAQAGRQYDLITMAANLRGVLHNLNVEMVCIEEGLARRKGRGFGATSVYHTGYGVALWVGMVAMAGADWCMVKPADWHRRLTAQFPRALNSKQRAIKLVQLRFPKLDLMPGRRRVPDSGLADAACIALCARQVRCAITC